VLHSFLLQNKDQILALTEAKTRHLAGAGPSSEQLKDGLPVFYEQLIAVLNDEQTAPEDSGGQSDDMESLIRFERVLPGELELALAAGRHGVELLRLGYTLSHVVHAYGAMCQSITELAIAKRFPIAALEFRDLNKCLDVAIARAVTEYEAKRDTQRESEEVLRMGFLAHELRNALDSVAVAHYLIKKGVVAPAGSTGQVLESGLRRLSDLIDRSLTQVRLRVDPKVHAESGRLLQAVDQIIHTARIQAEERNQTIEIRIDPDLVIVADRQLLHSALSNLIQNAIKYNHEGGRVEVRGTTDGTSVIIEIEDECGGLPAGVERDLFTPYEQHGADRSGVGLGLVLARRAVELSQGTLEVRNLPGRGCVFRVALPVAAPAAIEPAGVGV
jgi:signal transduction histidine kinase